MAIQHREDIIYHDITENVAENQSVVHMMREAKPLPHGHICPWRRTKGEKRLDGSEMCDLRDELCIQKCVLRRLVNGNLKWTGHVERRKDDCQPMKGK